MKKLVYCLFYIFSLLLSQQLFSQNVRINTQYAFSNYDDFEEYKKYCNQYEYENTEIQQRSDGSQYLVWGNENWLWGKTRRLSYDIGNMDKREFKLFADFITKDLLEAYIQFRNNYSILRNRLIFASPTLYPKYPNGFVWKNNKKFLEENNIDINKFSIDPTDITFEFTYGETGRMVAQAHSPLKDDIRIIINIDKWEQLNNYQRMWLMMHEWGHEAFGMKHGDNKIMYPTMPNEELSKIGYTNRQIVNMYDDLEKEIGIDFDNGVYGDPKWFDRASTIRREFVKKVEYLSEFERQKFGAGNYLSGDSTKPPIAFNYFFDSVLDFFDDLIKNRSSILISTKNYLISGDESNQESYSKSYIIINGYQFPNVLDNPENFPYRNWESN